MKLLLVLLLIPAASRANTFYECAARCMAPKDQGILWAIAPTSVEAMNIIKEDCEVLSYNTEPCTFDPTKVRLYRVHHPLFFQYLAHPLDYYTCRARETQNPVNNPRPVRRSQPYCGKGQPFG